jgi:hypothetical protein
LDAVSAAASLLPEGPIRLGSDAHKTLFCRTLLDTFNPYKPFGLLESAKRSGFFPEALVRRCMQS